MSTIENIVHNNISFAIIIRSNHNFKKNCEFITDSNNSIQIGIMKYDKNHIISPHFHNLQQRKINDTQEVLLVKKGKIKVNFFAEKERLVVSKILNEGDIILLKNGGHGFELLEDSEIIEIKQGPYFEGKDKTRFD